MRALNLRSILVASDLQPASDVAVRGAARLAGRLGAALHVVHATDIPSSGYRTLGVMMDFQRQMHDARRQLREQIERAVGPQQGVTSQQVRLDAPHRAINDRAAEVEADLIVLGPHRPQAFRGPILGNTADRVLRSAVAPVLLLPVEPTVPVRRVVVPVDLSDPSRGALDQGLVWANALGGADTGSDTPATELRVIHVIPRLYENYEFPFDSSVVVPQLQQEVEQAVERVGGPGGVRVRSEAIWGNAPADEILRYVGAQDADLLVMGTHGYGALGRALIGSITSRVARAAPCPMLMVPPPMWNGDDAAAAVPVDVELGEPRLPAA